jgi:type 1 glutamine amidotransferase
MLGAISADGQQASTASAAPPAIPGQNVNGMRIFIRAGLKTHAEGEHDYPQFLADWSKLLTERGAVVDGALHAPAAADLERTDVMVIYKGDAGYMTLEEKAVQEAFIRRGGGIVTIHDALCGPDPAYYAENVTGGAKKHGETNFTLIANVPYTIVDKSSPIVKTLAGVTLRDEAFYSMTWAKDTKIQVLATTVIDSTRAAGTHAGEVVPQVWSYEHTLSGGKPARAFVFMQGHTYANLAKPEIRDMLLRGISWAAKHPVEALVEYKAPAARPRQ